MNETITELGLAGVPVAKPTVEERVLDRFRKETVVRDDLITRNARLIEDLQIDWLDHYEIVAGLEGDFDIEIDDDEAELWSTVDDVIKYVESRTV